jgi:hypothetical protein
MEGELFRRIRLVHNPELLTGRLETHPTFPVDTRTRISAGRALQFLGLTIEITLLQR